MSKARCLMTYLNPPVCLQSDIVAPVLFCLKFDSINVSSARRPAERELKKPKLTRDYNSSTMSPDIAEKLKKRLARLMRPLGARAFYLAFSKI